MPNAIAYIAFQHKSTTGNFTIGSGAGALQAPKLAPWDEFTSLLDTLSPGIPSGQLQLDDDLDTTLRSKAEEMLPAGDWELGDLVTMSSCLSADQWKPCDPNKKTRGFVVKFESADLLAAPYVIYNDGTDVTFACNLETLIVIQII